MPSDEPNPPPSSQDGGDTAPQNDALGSSPAAAEATEPEPEPEQAAKKKSRWPWMRWRARPSVRTIKRRERSRPDYQVEWDERDNARLRLPEGDGVALAGIVLADAFTPSTVNHLFKTFERWPDTKQRKAKEWTSDLERSRHGGSGGWRTLGVVRRPGDFVLGDGYNDGTLPSFVDAVWLQLHLTSPSLAIVTATFTISDAGGDLGDVLSTDYPSVVRNMRVQVPGKLGRLRSRLFFCRPKQYSCNWQMGRPEDEKRRAVEHFVETAEAQCSEWFAKHFAGRFSAERLDQRPSARLFVTEVATPFSRDEPWLGPVGLDSAIDVYRSVEKECKGWALRTRNWPHDRAASNKVTFAANRSAAAHAPGGSEDGASNWYLTQRFGQDQAPLIAQLTVLGLLGLYGRELAVLRDKAGRRRVIRRPIRDARRLDGYLVGDGLDASSITNELGAPTLSLEVFRYALPEYTEDLSYLSSGGMIHRSAEEFVPNLYTAIRRSAENLASNTSATTENIRGSSELRQAVANTRLQRTVVFFSFLAVAIAVATLLLA